MFKSKKKFICDSISSDCFSGCDKAHPANYQLSRFYCAHKDIEISTVSDNEREKMPKKLIDYLPEFVAALEEQIKEDEKRWGDTWKNRPVEGQVKRAMVRLRDYEDQSDYAGKPFPWLKVAGEALIGFVRDNHPDYSVR